VLERLDQLLVVVFAVNVAETFCQLSGFLVKGDHVRAAQVNKRLKVGG